MEFNRCVCITCNPLFGKSFSIGEKEVLKYVKTLYHGNIEENYKGLGWLKNPNTGCLLELDIYIPELLIAIEYNSYHHTLQKVIIRDKIKKKLCDENGVKLITILESDWKNNTEVVKSSLSILFCNIA